jgi:hypothetical protein
MAQTNFTAGDMYPKAAPASAPKKVEAPAPAAKKAFKKPEPVVETPVVAEEAPAEEAAE